MNNSTSNHTTFFTLTSGELYFHTIFLSTVSIVTIIGNSLALWAFFRYRELKQITYYFIVNLCISDTTVALFSMPFWIAQNNLSFDLIPLWLTHVMSSIDVFCSTLSVMSLAMISVERYICIVYALRYKALLTKRRTYLMMTGTLVYSIFAVIINYFTFERAGGEIRVLVLVILIFFLSYTIPIFIKLYAYFHIYKEAKRQRRNIATLKRVVYTNPKGVSVTDESISESTLSLSSVAVSTVDKNSNRISWTTSPISRKRSHKRPCSPVTELEDDCHHYQSGDALLESYEPSRRQKFIARIVCTNCLSSSPDDTYQPNNCPEEKVKTLAMSKKLNVSIGNNLNGLNGVSVVLDYSLKEKVDKEPEELRTAIQKNTLGIRGDRKRSISCPPTPEQTSKTRNLSIESIEVPSLKKIISPRLPRFRSSTNSNSPQMNGKLGSKKGSQEAKARREHKIRVFRRELRAAKVVAFIMGAFIICWTPFMCLNLLYAFNMLTSDYKVIRIIMFAKDLHYLNSAINPILYVVLNKVYRSAIFKIVRLICTKLGCMNG